MTAKNVYNTVWEIKHIDPNARNATFGDPVPANQPLAIEHCATSHFLASDRLNYRNDFGMEFEVSVHSHATKNKSQQLNLEKVGKLTRVDPTKFRHDQNVWCIATAADPKLAEVVVEAPKYDA